MHVNGDNVLVQLCKASPTIVSFVVGEGLFQLQTSFLKFLLMGFLHCLLSGKYTCMESRLQH